MVVHGDHKSIHKDLPNVLFRDLRNRTSPIASLDSIRAVHKKKSRAVGPCGPWLLDAGDHSKDPETMAQSQRQSFGMVIMIKVALPARV